MTQGDPLAVRVVETRHGPMIVDPADLYVGQSLLRYGEFSPDEGALFQSLLSPGDVVVEAGAHIGAFTLCFANSVGPEGRVYAFEPQRRLFQMLCGTLALNEVTHVEAWPAGVGAAIGEMTAPAPSSPGVPSNSGAPSLQKGGPGETVPITTIDNLGLNRCTLIKADVQGMERELLEGAAKTIAELRPILYLENDQRHLSPALLRAIDALAYEAFWHLPPLFEAGNFNASSENAFPGIVSVNLLCVPKGSNAAWEGLRPVAGFDDWWLQK